MPSAFRSCDVAILRAVVLDWPDAEALRILEGMKKVLRPGATMLINEFVSGTQGRAMERTKRLLDLNIAATNIPGARVRGFGEHVGLLEKAGFAADAVDLVLLRSLPTVVRVRV